MFNFTSFEPVPFQQHGPGPIQRPNKLTTTAAQQSSKMPYLSTNIESLDTPDTLDHLKLVLENLHDAGTPTIASSTRNIADSTMPVNDLSTTNLAWTPYSPTTWSPRYDLSWPLTNIQSPTVPLTAQVQNPFAHMSPMNEQPRQIIREEPIVWSPILGTATPRFASQSTRTQRASIWNELFSSTVPSSTESTKPTNNSSWPKYYSASDPSSVDGTLPNGQHMEVNNPVSFSILVLLKTPISLFVFSFGIQLH